MKKEKNNLKSAISCRIFNQSIKPKGGVSEAYKDLKNLGWTSPQPLYNIENGDANPTCTSLYDIGMADKNFSADLAIFGEYRFPKEQKSIDELLEILRLKDAEIKEKDSRLNLYENLLRQQTPNFQTGDTNRLLADNILMMLAYPADFNKGFQIARPVDIN